MSIESQLEREEKDIEDRLDCGEIDGAQFNKEMNELQRFYRDMAEESAQDAYDKELGTWH